MTMSVDAPGTVLLTGATGAIGGALLPRLRETGHRVRCLVRDPARAQLPPDTEVIRGDVLTGEGLDEALAGVTIAYYLVHSMGRAQQDFEEADRQAARTVATAASAAGVSRVIYLGGLPAPGAGSAHLRSREEVASILRDAAPEVIHARAAMVIGPSSASFRMLRELVHRLPIMVGPKWIDTRSQPIAQRDVVEALVRLADLPDPPGDVELGGDEIITYREMMLRFARADGRRQPLIIPVPVLTPRLSSYWVGFVTSVDPGLARPLVDGLSEELIVRTPPPPGVNDAPLNFDDAVSEALSGLPSGRP
ncbi:unannotated protein [freshwater metagenome]|uniref:Unannotated protein n=1 Tax=freshwater metagenome TaxID=449393 RepID=A0A6J7CWA6_9ZZZZ|nr:NAD(P)H-binding protein [Actinomycetota bacterium]